MYAPIVRTLVAGFNASGVERISVAEIGSDNGQAFEDHERDFLFLSFGLGLQPSPFWLKIRHFGPS